VTGRVCSSEFGVRGSEASSNRVQPFRETRSHGTHGGCGGHNVRVHTATTASHGDHGGKAGIIRRTRRRTQKREYIHRLHRLTQIKGTRRHGGSHATRRLFICGILCRSEPRTPNSERFSLLPAVFAVARRVRRVNAYVVPALFHRARRVPDTRHPYSRQPHRFIMALLIPCRTTGWRTEM